MEISCTFGSNPAQPPSLRSLSPYLPKSAVALAHAALVAVLVLLAGERGRVRADLLLAPDRSHAPLPALADFIQRFLTISETLFQNCYAYKPYTIDLELRTLKGS